MVKRLRRVYLEQHVVNEVRRMTDERTKFFESDEFNRLIGIVSSYDRISHEELKYNDRNIDCLSSDDFGKVCDTVFFNLSPRSVTKSGFSEYLVGYRGIDFHLVVGQGSSYWTTKK